MGGMGSRRVLHRAREDGQLLGVAKRKVAPTEDTTSQAAKRTLKAVPVPLKKDLSLLTLTWYRYPLLPHCSHSRVVWPWPLPSAPGPQGHPDLSTETGGAWWPPGGSHWTRQCDRGQSGRSQGAVQHLRAEGYQAFSSGYVAPEGHHQVPDPWAPGGGRGLGCS